MAKVPTMTLEQAEAELGRRGYLNVSHHNRAVVRKWLTAQGLPSLFVGALAMKALQAAYNDESGATLERLKTQAAEAKADAGDDSADADNGDNKAANGHAVPNGDAGAQLASIIAAIAGKSVSPEAVAEIVDTRIASWLDTVPSVKIELTKSDGVTVNVDGHHHPKFATLLKVSAARQADGYHPNVWIAGPAGSGKTHAAKTVAHALELAFHYNGALSMPHELLGFIDAGGTYHRTPFREAYEHGGVYLFDEVDGSDNAALLALNAALANGRATFPDGAVERHKDSVIIATANTWGLGATADYVGRSKIDAAFLSRFPVRLAWDYDAGLETAIAGDAQFARRVIAARERARAAGLKVLIDPRASIAGSALIAVGMSSDDAAEITYLANLNPDQRRMVEGR